MIGTRFAIGLLILSAMLTACSGDDSAVPGPQRFGAEPTERVLDVIGGGTGHELITNTDTAAAYRIERDLNNADPDAYILKSDAVLLTKEQRNTLVNLLLDDGSYGWDFSKGCEPMPGVLVVFGEGEQKSELLLCYECQMLSFIGEGWEDFDPINADLTVWAKKVFPDDEAIQGL